MECAHPNLSYQNGVAICTQCGYISTSPLKFAPCPPVSAQKLQGEANINFLPVLRGLHYMIVEEYNQTLSVVGVQGMTGDPTNYVDQTIQLLDGSITLLMEMASKLGIPITRFERLALHENYISDDGVAWRRATAEGLLDDTKYRLTKTGSLLCPSCVDCPERKAKSNKA